MRSVGDLATRKVGPEKLDHLSPVCAAARESRRDLQKLNRIMGHLRVLIAGLRWIDVPNPMRAVDLGSGDGSLMLRLARALGPQRAGTRVVLVDRNPSVSMETTSAMKRLGWEVRTVAADVLEWCAAAEHATHDVVFANLFLHHLDDSALKHLLACIAERASGFLAIEPRRSRWALASSRMLWALNCNNVTCHDGPVSIRAGFAGRELSNLWPTDGLWDLREEPAGLWSHLFTARKRAGSPA